MPNDSFAAKEEKATENLEESLGIRLQASRLIL
jgi:hypothetical protein